MKLKSSSPIPAKLKDSRHLEFKEVVALLPQVIQEEGVIERPRERMCLHVIGDAEPRLSRAARSGDLRSPIWTSCKESARTAFVLSRDRCGLRLSWLGGRDSNSEQGLFLTW
jgi:hypothetical protein